MSKGQIHNVLHLADIINWTNLTMKLSHTSKKSVHAVFTSDFSWFRKMIHFLVSCESLISLWLDVAAGPHNCKLLIPLCRFPKTVVFKQITNKSHFNLIIKLKVVPTILRLVRPDTYRIDVWTEAYVLFKNAILHGRRLLQYILYLLWLILSFLLLMLNGPSLCLWINNCTLSSCGINLFLRTEALLLFFYNRLVISASGTFLL